MWLLPAAWPGGIGHEYPMNTSCSGAACIDKWL